MKYRDLKITFSIENIDFTILSICLEKLVRPIPKHSHSKSSYELHYISYGYGTLIAEGQEYAITPGSLFMTGPGVAHEQISIPEDPMTEYCVYFQIDKNGGHCHRYYEYFSGTRFLDWYGRKQYSRAHETNLSGVGNSPCRLRVDVALSAAAIDFTAYQTL